MTTQPNHQPANPDVDQNTTAQHDPKVPASKPLITVHEPMPAAAILAFNQAIAVAYQLDPNQLVLIQAPKGDVMTIGESAADSS